MAKSFKPTKYRGRPIWTVDAETDPFKKGRVPYPFIWGVYTGSEYYEFTDTESMIVFLQDQEVICYAHNGGKFDWHYITNYIDDYEPLTIIAGRLAKFTIGDCEFRDSYNIIPAPLSAYKKDDVDYNIFEKEEREKPENMEIIRAYLKSDCIYLHEMITTFVENYGMALTQASAAMKVWAKMSGISKPTTNDAYYDDLKKFYYGGRVECFQTGIIDYDFDVIDIRSAYPFAMMSEHPWGAAYSIYDYLPEMDDTNLSRCFITLKAQSLGAFPIREKQGLAFPNDGEIREFSITGWEYLAARDTDCLRDVEIIDVRKYFETINFKEYVDFFFELKEVADKAMKEAEAKGDYSGASYWSAMRLFAKLFLNSLYGKFASNPENYEEFMTVPAQFIDACNSDGWSYCKLLCEETAVVNRPLEEEKRRYYDVAVAASITGYVRAYLWRNVYATNGTVIYCDTDSIAASDISNINVGPELGAWEHEASCSSGAVAGKKLYAFRKKEGTYDKKKGPWKIASKGVRLEPEDIYAIAKGAAITYEPIAPTFSIKQGIRFTPRTIRMIEK